MWTSFLSVAWSTNRSIFHHRIHSKSQEIDDWLVEKPTGWAVGGLPDSGWVYLTLGGLPDSGCVFTWLWVGLLGLYLTQGGSWWYSSLALPALQSSQRSLSAGRAGRAPGRWRCTLTGWIRRVAPSNPPGPDRRGSVRWGWPVGPRTDGRSPSPSPSRTGCPPCQTLVEMEDKWCWCLNGGWVRRGSYWSGNDPHYPLKKMIKRNA